MSEQFRSVSDDALLSELQKELTQAQLTNASIAMVMTAYMEYYGPLPQGLDDALAKLAMAKSKRAIPPSLDSVLDDIKVIVMRFKNDAARISS